MRGQAVGIEARPPADWDAEIRVAFEAFVCSSGEVAGAGLAARIGEAALLVCHFDRGSLAAVAGLKNPRVSYREKLIDRSAFDLAADKYRFEVGWVYVAPEFRGAGLSRQLVECCLAGCNGAGAFATTREGNVAMQKTLKRCGFIQVGKPYKSQRGEASILLMVREPTDLPGVLRNVAG